MLSNGADIIHIQEILGHADVQTSGLYTHISPERLREKYNRTHPAAFGLIKETKKRAVTHPSVGRHFHAERKNSRRRVLTVRTDLDASILAYLEYRKPELSAQSVRTFAGYLWRFADFCFRNAVDSPGKITTQFLEKYQKHLAQRKKRPVRRISTGEVISVKTQKQEMEALCTCVRWCFSRGLILHDPSGGIVLPRIGTSLVAGILSRAEVEHVIGLPDTRYPYGLRDRAILELLYASGVREGELLNLRLTDTDYERDSLRVTAEKHGQDRVIPIGARAMKWLYRYVHEVRHHFVRDLDPGFLFLSNRGRRITSVYSHCRKYLDLAGIKKDQAVHIFRHSCAAHMIEKRQTWCPQRRRP
jgi:integrase/recombinase XerD